MSTKTFGDRMIKAAGVSHSPPVMGRTEMPSESVLGQPQSVPNTIDMSKAIALLKEARDKTRREIVQQGMASETAKRGVIEALRGVGEKSAEVTRGVVRRRPEGSSLENTRLLALLVKEGMFQTNTGFPQSPSAAMQPTPLSGAPQPANTGISQSPAMMQQMQSRMPQMAGQIGQPGSGLDGPMNTKATAMPGTPGHMATNVIDQQGGLDPMGVTIDGNNAAGTPKDGLMGKSAQHGQCFTFDDLRQIGVMDILKSLAQDAVRGATEKKASGDAVSSLSDVSQRASGADKWSKRLSELSQRRDPDGISQEPVDKMLRKTAGVPACACGRAGSSLHYEILGDSTCGICRAINYCNANYPLQDV